MISLSAYLLFLTTLSLAAALPGPGVATVVARTLSHGIRAGLLGTLGTICGDLLWLTVAILGLAALAKTFAIIFLAIKYVGAAYLLYLAFRLWRAPAQALDIEGAQRSGQTLSSFWISLSVTLSNPKTIMFYMAILPTLMDIDHIGMKLYLLLAATVTGVLAVVFIGYVLLAAGIRQTFRSSRAVRSLQRGTSLIMAGAAGVLALR